MEDSMEWKVLKMCCDQMGIIIKASVTYSNNDHFCSIVVDDFLIAATSGTDDLFATINATAKKAIRIIEDYSQQQMEGCSRPQKIDLETEQRRIFPMFEKYIANFKKRVDQNTSSNQSFPKQNNDTSALIPATYQPNYSPWSWSSANYNHWNSPNYNHWNTPNHNHWNTPNHNQNYNQNYYLTKNYTTTSTDCVKVKIEPREIKVVKRKMLHPSFIERHNCIDQSNIGFKMLLGLGWAGGPLGPNHDGIAEPISVKLRTRRSGLGCADRHLNKLYGNINGQNLFQYLKQYADDQRQYEDLEFSDDFSQKEKKKLLGISKDLNLQHVSEQRNGMLVVRIMKPIYK